MHHIKCPVYNHYLIMIEHDSFRRRIALLINICYKKTLSDFAFCEFCLCKKITAKPEEQPSEAIPEDTKANINSDQNENIKINLIRKIQIINSCTSQIISQTQIYIAKIQSMCMHSIKTLNVKKQYYIISV